MITIMSYCDRCTSNNNWNHTISQIFSNTKKNVMFFKLFTKTQILIELINVNHKDRWNINSRNHQLEIQKSQKGEAYHKTGAWKLTNTCITKWNAIPWLLTINFEPKLHKKARSLWVATLPILSRNSTKRGFSLPRR